MSYSYDLHYVDPGLDVEERRAAVMRAVHAANVYEPTDEADRERKLALPPSAEQARLAALLEARFPQLGITRKSARVVELRDRRLSVEVLLFEKEAGIGIHGYGSMARHFAKYLDAAHLIWGCIELLDREGHLAAYDPAEARVIDVPADVELVLKTIAGDKAVELYRESYAFQLAAAAKAGAPRPYSPQATYAVGELVEHPKFGAGVVRSVAASRVTVLFESGAKTLVCASSG